MGIKHPTEKKSRILDKETLRVALRNLDAEAGFRFDPTATAERAQLLAREEGIRPEDNLLSSEILRQRYGDEGE